MLKHVRILLHNNIKSMCIYSNNFLNDKQQVLKKANCDFMLTKKLVPKLASKWVNNTTNKNEFYLFYELLTQSKSYAMLGHHRIACTGKVTQLTQ